MDLLEAFRDLADDGRWPWGACDASLTPRPLDPPPSLFGEEFHRNHTLGVHADLNPNVPLCS